MSNLSMETAMDRAQKQEAIEALKGVFADSGAVVVTHYMGLTVAEMTDLRGKLRQEGAQLKVVKNTLAERAAEGSKIAPALKNLTGVTSVVYTKGDPVALAKALSKYAKDNPEFTFKAGIVEGKVISIKEIEALATMPSKEEIYSKLLFLLNAPAQRLVTVMNATGRDLAVVINQGVKENKFAGGASAPAAEAPAAEAAPAQ
jgi:large subunit ribosomal protein L10